jgi:hypothetical protein
LVERTMPTPAELREESRLCRQAAEEESDPHRKQLWASHALELAQLAEKVEREDKARTAA